MGKKQTHVPGRRSSGRKPQTRLGRKVFAYFTQEEGQRLEVAARKRRRSISSYVAEATLERIDRDLSSAE